MTSVVSLLKMHNLNPIMRAHQVDLSLGTFYKTADLYTLKNSRLWKTN